MAASRLLSQLLCHTAEPKVLQCVVANALFFLSFLPSIPSFLPFFLVMVGLGFEIRALCLPGRCFTS
jgi:hypothetical protein